jgi:hypothetical protein
LLIIENGGSIAKTMSIWYINLSSLAFFRQANACLTNVAKREAFDFERYKHFCIECKRIPYTTSANVSVNSGGSGFKAWNIITKSRSFKFWRNIKDVRERFNEEAKVIENCLRVNSMSRKESPLYNPASYLHRSKSMHRFEKETPVFNPSDYLYQGYPHMRGLGNKNSSTFMYLQTASILQNEKRGAQHSSPVFEVKTRSMFTNQFAFVSSRY